MKFSTFPAYLSPAALPNGATREAQLLHLLRQRCGLAVTVLGEAKDYIERFEKFSTAEQKAAGETLDIDTKTLLKAAHNLCDARPALVEDEPQKAVSQSQTRKSK